MKSPAAFYLRGAVVSLLLAIIAQHYTFTAPIVPILVGSGAVQLLFSFICRY